MNKLQQKNTVKSYETDAFGRVSLGNIFYYFQEAANLHATSLGWGLEYLESIQKFWILSRLKMVIGKYPVHKDEFTLDTWSRGAEGFFAFRDYQVKINNEAIIDAVSSWMILDRNTHRPCKIEQIGKEVPRISESFLLFPENKLPQIENKTLLFEKKVNFSDIDINLHVNNGKYVEIIMDAISERLMLSDEIKEIDIQFLHESQLNDILLVYTNTDIITSSEIFISIDNITKGKETCRCGIKFKFRES